MHKTESGLKKVGRPKKNKPKTEIIPVRINAEDRAHWEAAAKKRGLPLSGMIRVAVGLYIARPSVARSLRSLEKDRK